MAQNQTTLSFPESITTARLLLRGYRAADADAVKDLVDANRDRLRRNFPEMAQDLHTPADVTEFFLEKSALWKMDRTYCYGIWQRAHDSPIGQLQVKDVRRNIPAAELSYFIGAAHVRQGYASEAIKAVLAVAFDTLAFQRIYLRIIQSNTESLALADKLGFTREGLHRNEFRCGYGELHDVHFASLVARDWHADPLRHDP